MLAMLVLLGGGLRLWNVRTATIHPDEQHYTDDACWAIAPMSLPAAIRFLREHPYVHYKLSPETGTLSPWPTTGRYVLGGHLPLHAYVTGPVLALLKPDASARVLVARGVNTLADTATITLLPGLVTALGGSAAAGMVSAALYAVFPPAIVYGSIANLDPFLAPLLILLLRIVLQASDHVGSWLLAGAVTGLLTCAKQPGLLALGLVPALAWRRGRRLALWAIATVGVSIALVSPTAYVHGLWTPSDPYLQLRFEPLAFATANVVVLSHPATWYWLSFSYHGRPLADAFARVHQFVTPLYLLGYVLALPVLVVAGRGRALVALFGPTLFLLAFIEPSNGASRFQMAAPQVCAAIALAWDTRSRAWRTVMALGASGLLFVALMPARLDATGAIDLGDLLFWNPQAVQRYGYYPSWSRPLRIQVHAGAPISRRLWLPAGQYQVDRVGSGPIDIRLDGQPAVEGGGAVTTSAFPRIELSTSSEAQVRQITVRRVDVSVAP